ncbi:MAG: glycosyl transferase [Gloeocapsa sp. DLM2.Bin57]|nr:MAG: glycosyl transferase [Gloeocapsa sp. DLM2.Bin57]
MQSRVLNLIITSHGFGHAVRVASVAGLLKKLYPEIVIIFTTGAPRWLLESYLEDDFIYRPRSFDVGVIQADSLTMDKQTTLAQMQQLQKSCRSIVASEVNYLKNNRVNLVLADIPNLAPLIAQGAGIPCWMMGNFGWDFIYRPWGGEFTAIADWIAQGYQQCDRLFRLPLSESMSAFANITDVGLTGGTPKYAVQELKAQFGIISPTEQTVLLTFGGLGLQKIPYENLNNFPQWQFITFDSQAPDLPNLIKVQDYHYRPVDFMPLCGRVISKPGYSTFAEALRLDIPIISLTREDFAESSLLLDGLKEYAWHQIVSVTEFSQSNWEFLTKPLIAPQKEKPLCKNGTEVIANQVLEYFRE